MFKHEISTLLRTFSASEIKRFRNFLDSPYFNKNKKVITLYKEFLKFYPNFSFRGISKRDLYLSMYKKHKYNDSTFRNLLFRLKKLLLKFLLFNAFEKNNFEMDNYLLSELNGRNSKKLFFKKVEKIEKSFNNNVKVDCNYLYNNYLFFNNKFNFEKINDKVLNCEIVSRQINDLQISNISLTIFYITELISDYLNRVMYSLNYNSNIYKNEINSILQNFNIENVYNEIKNKYKYSFLLEMYINLLKCFASFRDFKKYFDYKNLVYKYLHLLSSDEITFHFTNLINYCILRTRLADLSIDFNKELFVLYNDVLKREYFKDSKSEYLSYKLFRDILLLALRLKEYEWSQNFVESFCIKLHPNYRKNMHNFGLAFLYDAKGDFTSSLNYLNRINLEYFIYKYDVRKLKLKLFYELNYLEECLCLIHSSSEFLRKDVLLPQERKNSIKLLFYYLEKLIFYKMGKPSHDIGFIKQKILSEKNISNRNWILEKIKEAETPLSIELSKLVL